MFLDEPGREGEHPQTLLTHARIRGVDVRVDLRDGRLCSGQRASRQAAPGQHHVRRPFHELDDPVDPAEAVVVEGGHELVVGVERHFGQSRVGPAGLFRVHAELGRQHDEGGLGRIADHAAVVGDGGVTV
jgi:hypothetical protein